MQRIRVIKIIAASLAVVAVMVSALFFINFKEELTENISVEDEEAIEEEESKANGEIIEEEFNTGDKYEKQSQELDDLMEKDEEEFNTGDKYEKQSQELDNIM